MDWKQQNCLQKENYKNLGEPLLDLFPSYSLWFLFCGSLVLSLVWSGWDWRREGLKEGSSQIWGKIFGSTCRSEHICGWVLLPSEAVSLRQSLLWSLSNFGDSQPGEGTVIWRKKNPKSKAWKLSQVLIKYNCMYIGPVQPAQNQVLCTSQSAGFWGLALGVQPITKHFTQWFITFTSISVDLNENLKSLVLQEKSQTASHN